MFFHLFHNALSFSINWLMFSTECFVLILSTLDDVKLKEKGRAFHDLFLTKVKLLLPLLICLFLWLNSELLTIINFFLKLNYMVNFTIVFNFYSDYMFFLSLSYHFYWKGRLLHHQINLVSSLLPLQCIKILF